MGWFKIWAMVTCTTTYGDMKIKMFFLELAVLVFPLSLGTVIGFIKYIIVNMTYVIYAEAI